MESLSKASQRVLSILGRGLGPWDSSWRRYMSYNLNSLKGGYIGDYI